MFAAIVGDVLGSIHEKIPNYVNRQVMSPTDDSFLTCACFEWINSIGLNKLQTFETKGVDRQSLIDELKLSAIYYLKLWQAKYPGTGFSKGFTAWAQNPDFIQGTKRTNGSLMRQSPIAQYCVDNGLSIDTCLLLSEIFASPTHHHSDTYPAVFSHSTSIYNSLKGNFNPKGLKTSMAHTPYAVQPLEYWENKNKFIWDAPQTLAIVYSAIYHATSFQGVIDNCIYVGGDVDTYCAIAGPIAAPIWPISPETIATVEIILESYPDVANLFAPSNIAPKIKTSI